jgi:hypothetical protein
VKPDFGLVYGTRLLVLLGIGGCGSSPATTTVAPHPSVVEVSPAEFRGAPICANAAGALRTYVATLTDVGFDGSSGGNSGTGGNNGTGGVINVTPPIDLPSSLPISCAQSVAFGWVVAGHRYSATVQGYDRDDLVALRVPDPKNGNAPITSGLPILLDPATQEPVAPRWTTHCGTKTPVLAEFEITRRVTDCEEWSGGSAPGPSQVRVGIASALGEIRCGTASDQIEHFVVRLDGREVGSGACDEVITLTDLPANEFTRFDVLAFPAEGSSPSLGGTCSVTPVAGLGLDAKCLPFASAGGIDLGLPDVLSRASARCDNTLDRVSLVLDGAGPAIVVKSDGCAGHRQFAGLAPGEHTIDASVRVKDAPADVAVRCTASVEPGLIAAASCALTPAN